MAEPVSVEFESPAGETLRFEWAPEALERLDPAADELPWTLSGELDWDEVEAVRVFSGRLDDGCIAIAALRPRGAAGHGDELIAGALLGEEGAERLDEALLSAERDGAGAVRRIGLELYGAQARMPVRVAGDAIGSVEKAERGVTRTTVEFELRAAGATGAGRLDLLAPR